MSETHSQHRIMYPMSTTHAPAFVLLGGFGVLAVHLS